MKRKIKHGIILGILTASAFGFSTAHACSTLAGYTCFGVSGTNSHSGVFYTNANWNKFGWEDKANWFRNNGRYQDICLYTNRNYGGSVKCLARGEYFKANKGTTFYKSVSSNHWVTYGC